MCDCLWTTRTNESAKAITHLEAKARELDRLHDSSARSRPYFQALVRFIKIPSGSIRVEELVFVDSVKQDIRQMLALRRPSSNKIAEIETALQMGIPRDSIEECVDDIIDDETTLNTYLALIKESRNECSVCLESYTASDLLAQHVHRTACGHFFHRTCMQSIQTAWGKDHCPLCRRKWTLPEDSDRWNRYLARIQQRVQKEFPDVVVTAFTDDAGVLEDDETIARRLQKEFEEEVEEDRRQQRSDFVFALGFM